MRKILILFEIHTQLVLKKIYMVDFQLKFYVGCSNNAIILNAILQIIPRNIEPIRKRLKAIFFRPASVLGIFERLKSVLRTEDLHPWL